MSELNNLGKVLTTDVLIIGAGNSAMACALKIKQLNSDIDVLCAEKGYFGYNGKSTKAGHGYLYMGDNDDVEDFVKQQVEENHYGLYLNDQDYLYRSTREINECAHEMEELGSVFAHNEDGTIAWHKEYPTKKCCSLNIDIDYVEPLSRNALKRGVRIAERIYITDLLKDGERVVGAVGFHMDAPSQFYIIRARAVVIATCEFNPCVRLMFYGPATGLDMAYRAGAEIRNAEQSTNYDLCHRNTGNFMYGVHWIIFNSKGENVFQKYSTNMEEIDHELMLGLIKEIEMGNAPFHINFAAMPHGQGESEGEGFNMGNLMPKRLDLDKFIFQGKNRTDNPEISMVTYVFNRGLRVDWDAKTTVPALWSTGGGTLTGCAYGGWVHGDGVAKVNRDGLHAAKSIVREIDDITLGQVDIEQVKALKARVYEPFSYTGKKLPYHVIHYLDRLICMPENSITRSEESIHNVLRILDEERKNLASYIYVPEGDGHHLARAIEARAMIDQLEVLYTAFDTRKETRGYHMRVDYPERDDKNWLKWVVISRGKDGKPAVRLEPVPLERYKYRPEGWTPDEAAQ